MRINPETAKNIKTSTIFLFLTGLMFFLIFRFGLSAAVSISEFLQKNKPGNEATTLDNYLPSPKFNSSLEATNSASLPISGFGPANKEVLITLNGFEDKSLAVDSEGKFEGFLDLSLGVNNFYATARDFNGNLSSPSETISIFYSDSPPSLEITEPEENSLINNNPNITIKGKTDSNSKIYINSHLIRVENSGDFSYETKLVKGENIFQISAIDPANNSVEKEFKLQFRP